MSEDLLSSLPLDYEPFETLDLCSNRISARVPLMVQGVGAPLLIGKGDNPKVWMAVAVSKPERMFFYIVQNNSAMSPQVQVIAANGTTTIRSGENVLCRVTRRAENEAAVTELDLRAIGLNIVGTASELSVGGNKLIRSNVGGSGVAIGILLGGDPAPAPGKRIAKTL